MELNDEQNERIARLLDGATERLSAYDQVRADNIRLLEGRIGLSLDVHVPPETLAAVRTKILIELARRPRRRLRVGSFIVAALAAAAALVMAVALWWTQANSSRLDVPTAVLFGDMGEFVAQQGDLASLARQVSALEEQMVASLSPPSGDEAEDVETENGEDLWLEEVLKGQAI
jgi:hypothetical protein